MRVRIDDNCPHRFWVSSETDGEREYLVELGSYPRYINEYGQTIYNGSCIATIDPNSQDDGVRQHGCRDYIFRCEPKLKRPENDGKIFRCKHIRAAREVALDFVIPHLVSADPNHHEQHMP